jgi:hypothetical protein
MKSDYWLIHGVSNEDRSGHGLGKNAGGRIENKRNLNLEWHDKPKKETHKKEGRLRPEVILGRIDLLNNQSVYPQGANSGSSLWVFQKAIY